MQKVLNRPVDNYDPLWIEYWKQNPTQMRSVGAEAAETDGGEQEAASEEQQGGDENQGGEEQQAASQEQTDDWRSTIEDEDVRKVADRYTSPADLAKAYSEANKALSQRIKVPGKDASEEDQAKFRKAIGVPDSPDEYKIERPEHITEEEFKGEEYTAVLGSFKQRMHEAGVPSAGVSAALNTYFEMEKAAKEEQVKADEEHIATADAALRKEWGKDYDKNVMFAKAFIEKQGGAELMDLQLKDGSMLQNNVAFLRLAGTTGRRMGEGSLQIGLEGTDAGQDLKAKAEQLTKEYHEAYNSGDHDKANRINEERRKINSQLTGFTE